MTSLREQAGLGKFLDRHDGLRELYWSIDACEARILRVLGLFASTAEAELVSREGVETLASWVAWPSYVAKPSPLV